MISSSAPKAAIVRSFSSANAFELMIRSRYPFSAHTNARELPVEPPGCEPHDRTPSTDPQAIGRGVLGQGP